jgi:hypothetical protein
MGGTQPRFGQVAAKPSGVGDAKSRCPSLGGAGGHEITGVFGKETVANQEAEHICSIAETRRVFFDTLGWLRPDNICPDDFSVEAYELQRFPTLDDWVDRKSHTWDCEAVLLENEITVAWGDTLVDGSGNRHRAGDFAGWGFYWKHGTIHIGRTAEIIARKAAAMFVSLWLRGVSASFADKLTDGYICFLERQKNTMLTFLAEIGRYSHGGPLMRLTREGFCTQAAFEYDVECKIIEALNPQPDEEIIVTFTKRKRSPITLDEQARGRLHREAIPQ